jgi:hypothetical protein
MTEKIMKLAETLFKTLTNIFLKLIYNCEILTVTIIKNRDKVIIETHLETQHDLEIL